MKLLVLDVETTISNKGNPFDITNKLVCISWWWNGKAGAARASPELYPKIQKIIDEADLVIGFNFKFDYHWLRKVGINLTHKKLWDCQLVEFLLDFQRNPYPSLEQACVKYGLGHKLDIIKTEYWNKGIDTPDIPWDILKEYATLDAILTYKLYLKQKELVTPIQNRLLSLQFQDIHVLEEMEWNGLKYDADLCSTRSQELNDKISTITTELSNIYPDVPINFNSNDDVSAFLYGGTIKQEVKEHVGFYKTGQKTGQPKYAKKEIEHTLPALFKPLKGSELKKEGLYSTSEDTLKQLKGPAKSKKVLAMLLDLAKGDKLNSTYYIGLPKLNKTMNWPESYLHGNFNQCVTVTGRLSSSKPNLQNFASDLQDIFITRY